VRRGRDAVETGYRSASLTVNASRQAVSMLAIMMQGSPGSFDQMKRYLLLIGLHP
jgi:hypothetical protein